MTVMMRKCFSKLVQWMAFSVHIPICSIASQNSQFTMSVLLNGTCITSYLTVASNCNISLSSTVMQGGLSAWKIHAPDSKPSFLELDFCCLGKLEVLCLPKLERLRWSCWICPNSPLSFDIVPSFNELNLTCGATRAHRGFNLSEVLRHTTSIHNLSLNFQGEKLWIKPEGKQLCTAFSKLKKLSLHGIFVEFDILWTIVLLEAAPSVEMFDVDILLL